jgi:hypothetical protein
MINDSLLEIFCFFEEQVSNLEVDKSTLPNDEGALAKYLATMFTLKKFTLPLLQRAIVAIGLEGSDQDKLRISSIITRLAKAIDMPDECPSFAQPQTSH